ncbi:MAG: serine protease [Marinilabiliales bacterium]|nr:MAG: serine protease [Marinilabiliales bacterium]
MRKLLVLITGLFLLVSPLAKADEGMWLPLFVERLNYTDMQEMGLQLTAEEIYSINNSSLKDAIIIFGGGCTGEIVSDQGLIFTNHHCGYGYIQAHSTVEHDYLTEGFWARSFEEELPNEGIKASFLVRIEDVTNRVLEVVNDQMSEGERAEAIGKISKEIEKEAVGDTHYQADVKSFFHGNEYYLFVYEVYTDVRLVGTPPSSIGKFGADTDNWMWPRHTGDFSIFRVYAGKDNMPAEYSEENVPMKPRHHLPVSIKGVKKDDFAMIMGYPGGTERFLTSYGVEYAIEVNNPSIVKIRRKKLDIMREGMDASDAVRIQYASKYARTANYWKYFIGQTKGLKRLDVYGTKLALENKFTEWLEANPDMNEKYGEALPTLKKAYWLSSDQNLWNTYFFEGFYRGAEIFGFSRRFGSLAKMLDKKDATQEEIDGMIAGVREMTKDYFKDYNQNIDKNLVGATLEMVWNKFPADMLPEELAVINEKYDGDFNAYAEKLFAKSIFTSEESVNEFLDNPKGKKILKDPAYELANAFINYYISYNEQFAAVDDMMSRGNRLFVAGLREMQKDKKFYPDANFTMRLTYGSVQDYKGADAVYYNYLTTLDGVMEKEDPNNWEFVVHPKLKELWENKDYGRYGDDGQMYVCFLTTNDITGGNSGSPVINANGELIGLAFDGNWEAMSGDIAFEPELQRTICVDARYVLFIIDKFAGATNIIDELTIVE